MARKIDKKVYNDFFKALKKNEVAKQKETEAHAEASELKNNTEAKNDAEKKEASAYAPYVKPVNPLKLYRQYNTYQALLDVYPQGDMSVDEAHSKVILYVMKWYRERISSSDSETRPEIKEIADRLKLDYPAPADYKDFDKTKIKPINPYSFSDVKTIYDSEKKVFKLRLNEPDNGTEKKEVTGRSFTTEVCVYPGEASVVIGTRVSCREPEENTEDAAAFRPAYIRAMFLDEDLLITEAGIDAEYAFARTPVIVNGKSEKDCGRLVKELVESDRRNMPVIFVPGYMYDDENLKSEINRKTESLLGFCHMVVWTDSPGKLFGKCICSQELVEVAEEGQIIYYRTPSFVSYYETGTKEVFGTISDVGHGEPIRKEFNFNDCDFELYNVSVSPEDNLTESYQKLFEEHQQLKNRYAESGKDTENLQMKLKSSEEANKRLDKLNSEATRNEARACFERDKFMEQNRLLKEENRILRGNNLMLETLRNANVEAEKKKYEPVLNLPPLNLRSKPEIMEWIKKYYSDVLIIHSTAEDSYYKDSRNIDFRIFCMLIHYLAGFTIYRNKGMDFEKANEMARDYDPDSAGYKVEPASTGPNGALNIHKEKYLFNITEHTGDPKDSKAVMDFHIGHGKGMDDDMIRIYGCYCPKLKKFIVGKMLEHLPTKKDPH